MWVEFAVGSLMLREFFLRVLQFSPLRKKNKKQKYNLQFFNVGTNDNGNTNNNSNYNEGGNDNGNNSE